MEKFSEKARIVFQEQVAARIYRLRLEAERISRAACAGQFVMLRVTDGTDPLLRRPFSLHRIHADEGAIEVLYRVAGRGTLVLSRLGPGAEVGLIGPLGNGFRLPVDGTAPIGLIAGGIGVAPLVELITRIVSGSAGTPNVHLFHGARTASELLPARFLEFGIPIHFATDDGSFGYNGRITRLFEDFTGSGPRGFRPREVYACGPLAMQYHVAKWALANVVPAQLSLESLMACGIGACLGCALPATDPDSPGTLKFVHVCEDGPIFSAGSIKWNQILVQQTPPPTYLFS